MAEQIPQARFVELPGVDHQFWWIEADADAVVAEIEEFMTGVRSAPPVNRVLATVLFTDIVGSTEQASRIGDRRWLELLDDHDLIVRRSIEDAGGSFIKSTGDGALAVFDGPGRALRAAQDLRRPLGDIGITVRCGLHTGEIERRGEDIGGIAVHIGSRVAALARADEVLVSSMVVDLVAGSGITFEDRGEHELKGVPGTWRLFAVAVTAEGTK